MHFKVNELLKHAIYDTRTKETYLQNEPFQGILCLGNIFSQKCMMFTQHLKIPRTKIYLGNHLKNGLFC